MTSEVLGEMSEGDSADKCGEKFPLVSMGGWAEGRACTDPGARTPIGASGILLYLLPLLHRPLQLTLQWDIIDLDQIPDICKTTFFRYSSVLDSSIIICLFFSRSSFSRSSITTRNFLEYTNIILLLTTYEEMGYERMNVLRKFYLDWLWKWS